MITTYKIPYGDGELRIGWASWDDGQYESRSIKYAYRDSSGKISRGCPELPFDVLVAMLVLAADQKELDEVMPETLANPLGDVSDASLAGLRDEKKLLSLVLIRLLGLISDVPWVNWQPVYNQVGVRLDAVRDEISRRLEDGR